MARNRRGRILAYMVQDPPLPYQNILKMEGVTDRYLRKVIKSLEEEHEIAYLGTVRARAGAEPPVGLTRSTARLRANLANELYKLREPGNTFGFSTPSEVALATGIGLRGQIAAANKPFAYDWSMSEIERMARVLGEEPMEFLLRCLTT